MGVGAILYLPSEGVGGSGSCTLYFIFLLKVYVVWAKSRLFFLYFENTGGSGLLVVQLRIFCKV